MHTLLQIIYLVLNRRESNGYD